eukprot:PhM_4_TR7398/c0_g1_i1/m.66479
MFRGGFVASRLLLCSTSASSMATAAAATNNTTEQQDNNVRTPTETLRRSADARHRIHTLWTSEDAARTPAAVTAIFKEFNISPKAPRESDVTRGLGEAAERLLILAVEAQGKAEADRIKGGVNGAEAASLRATGHVSDLLRLLAANGVEMDVRTIQHLFARCYNYVQALSLFDEFKKCGMVMNAHSYYVMVFCLQRLEEESWGRHFCAEREKTRRVTEEMYDFVLNGCEHQLIPESKPYLGRVMFADQEHVYPDGRKSDFDATGRAFRERFEKKKV